VGVGERQLRVYEVGSKVYVEANETIYEDSHIV